MKLKKIHRSKTLEFYTVDNTNAISLPLVSAKVSAGFPSPAEDYVEQKLDLNKFLIKHPSATFYVKVKGDSMKDAKIEDGDLLIVDRSIEPKNNDVAVCIIDGEFTVKRVRKIKSELFLVPDNPDYQPIKVTEAQEFQIWGVVAYIIHKPGI